MTACYCCARDLDIGHHGGCPILTMPSRRVLEYLGAKEGARHIVSRPEPATPTEEADTQPVRSTGNCFHLAIDVYTGKCKGCGIQFGLSQSRGYLTGSGVLA